MSPNPLSNTTGHEIEITEAAFTNLPQGFSLKSNYYDESVIRLEPQSQSASRD
jgi:hypothetical protein